MVASGLSAFSLAPCTILRVGGLSLAASDGRSYGELALLLDERMRAAEQLTHDATSLADGLYGTIGRSQDSSGPTRALITLRRDAHNGRIRRSPHDEVLAFLQPGERRLVAAVLADAAALSELDVRIERAATRAVRLQRERILEESASAEFADALALASPDLAISASESEVSDRRLRKTTQALSSYVGRASRKTSPFSRFTEVGVHPAGSSAEPVGRDFVVSRALLQTVMRALAGMPALAGVLRFSAPGAVVSSPHAEASGGVLVAKPVVYDGFFFAEDELLEIGVGDAALTAATGTASLAEWASRLGLAHDAMVRLVGTGILRPVPPSGGMAQLSTAVSRLLGGDHEVAAALDAAARAAVTARDGHAAARAEGVVRLRSATAEVIERTGSLPPEWLAEAHLVHETCEAPPDRLPTIDRLDPVPALRTLGEILAPGVRVSRVYGVVLDAFLAAFGPAGSPSLLDFVARLLRSEAFSRMMLRAAGEDLAGSRGDHPLATGDDRFAGIGTVAPPAFCAFFQPVGRPGDPTAGPAFVINRVNQGAGGLLLRWAKVETLRKPLADALVPWMAALHPGARLVMATSGDAWSDLQALPHGVMDALGWPTSPPGPRGGSSVLTADAIVVTYHAESHTLQLRDRATGQPVALPYLGVVPPHLLRGASRVLQCLSDPWAFDYRLGADRTASWWWPTGGVERIGRLQREDVIHRRAAWLIPVDELPDLSGSAGATAILVHEWRRRHDLPRRVFARAGRDRLASRPPKPQFVDLLDPLSLEVISRMARRNDWITLEEAVPDEEDAWWPAGAEGDPRAVELSAVLTIGEGARV